MDSIKVAIKVRPLIKREKEENLPIQWTVQDNSIAPLDPELKKRGEPFYFDHIFDTSQTNYDVFNVTAKPIIDAAINGINGTIFAYGQTSSGKTFTMMGEEDNPGVIPLSVDYIFDKITSTYDREFLLRVSYIEIYNEKINDLLDKNAVDLKIKEEKSGQTVVFCKEEVVNSSEFVLAIMRKGIKNRRIGETNMNERSSRSHTIFRITIESREQNSDGVVHISQLNLVDLAGSERPKQSGATGDRFNEGRHINLSLSALGLVIMQLSECQDNPQRFVNFRDSKLTRILQASLGGNAMTTIICAVTPAALEETQCTLAFASRAKRIKNKPQVNECVSDAALLKRYAKQLAKLKDELEKAQGANLEEMESKLMEKESKLMEKDRAYQLLEERIELLKTRIVSGNSTPEEEKFRRRSRRRRTWGGPGTFQTKPFNVTGSLPTIKESEKTPEKTKKQEQIKRRQSIIQSLDIPNQTFQTAFTDFELELIESERSRNRLSDGSSSGDYEFCITTRPRRNVKFMDDVMVSDDGPRSPETTPEKNNREPASPETPRAVLRSRITFLMEQYNALTNDHRSLVEFTHLERQMFVEEAVEAAMVEHNKTVEDLRQALEGSEQARQELHEKYTKLQNHSSESDKRLEDLQRELTESANALRTLRNEKEILVQEIKSPKTVNRAQASCNVTLDKETSSIFANNTYFEEMDVSDTQCDSSLLMNDTGNTERLLISDITLADNNPANNKLDDSKKFKDTTNATYSEFMKQISEKSSDELVRVMQDLFNTKVSLEEENTKLEATLRQKVREADDVKNDIRELKSGIEKLQETIHMLTTENTDLTSKLTNEKEFAKEAEKNFQSTIAELDSRIDIMAYEKLATERTVKELNDKLKSTVVSDEKTINLINEYKRSIDSLTTENIELSSNLMTKIEELDRLKDVKAVSGDHACEYRESVISLTGRNKLLESENVELSDNLMEKIEEYDRLREEYERSRCQLSSSPQQQESNKLVDISVIPEDLLVDELHANEQSNRRTIEMNGQTNGRTVDDLLRMSIVPGESLASINVSSNEKDIEQWKLKAELLEEQVEKLTLLNDKLSSLKTTSCKQCAHLVELRDNRRMLQNEVKSLNRMLEELQTKFDLEFAHTTILRTKASEDLNLSVCDTSLNASTNHEGALNVSHVEERVQLLHNEIEFLRNKHDKLSNLYREKCEEIEKLQDGSLRETTPPATTNESPRSRRDDSRLDKIHTDMEKMQSDLRHFKKTIASTSSAVHKFVNEKNTVQSEIETLKLEFEEKLREMEISSVSREKYESLENRVSSLTVEIDNYKIAKEQWENEKTLQDTKIQSLQHENKNLEEKVTAGSESLSIAREKMKALENEVSRLESEIANHEMIAEQLKSAKLSFEAQVQSLIVEKQNLEEKIMEIESSLVPREKVESLANEVARMRSEMQNYELAKEELEVSKLSLENQVQTLRDEKEKERIAMSEMIAKKEEAIETLENQVVRLTSTIEDSNVARGQLNDEKTSLETQIELLKMEKESLEKILVKNENLTLAEEKIRTLENEVSSLTVEINNFRVTQQELEEAKSWLEDKVQSLKTENEAFGVRLSETESVSMAREKIELLENEVSRLISEIENAKVLQDALEDAKSSLKAELDVLKSERTSRDEIIEELQRTLRDLGDTNSDLRTTIGKLNAEKVEIAQRESERAHESSDRPNDDLEALEKNVELLELQLEEVTNNSQTYMKMNSDLNNQLEQSKMTENELSVAKMDLEKKIEALIVEKANAQANERNLTESLNQVRIDNETLTTLAEELESQIEKATENLNEKTKKNMELKKRLEEYCDESNKIALTNEIKNLRVEITNARESMNVLRDTIQKLEETNSSLMLELEESKRSHAIPNNNELNDAPYETLKEYENMIEELKEKLQLTTEELQSNTKKIIVTNDELRTVNEAREELNEMRLALERKVEDLNTEKNELQQTLTNLRKTLNDLDEKNARLNEELQCTKVSRENPVSRDTLGLKTTNNDRIVNDSSIGITSTIEKSLSYEASLEELESAKKSITKEIMSLKASSENFKLEEKSATELFNFFVTTIMSKEHEVMRALNDNFEREKRRLEDKKRQSLDAEKRAAVWAKELEAEIERTQQDLMRQETKRTELCQKITKLENLLLETNHENQMLKEKMAVLEADYDTLETNLDKSPESRQSSSTVLSANQDKERFIHESVDTREMELSAKLRLVEKQYKEKLDELTSNIEHLKTRNIDLSNNLEGLEANERQLKSIVDMRTNELAKCNITIERMQQELNAMTESYNQSSRDNVEKMAKIEEITSLLKTKCDLLSEYKTKLETITPEYEKLKDQANERQLRLEKYKSEIECLTAETEKTVSSLKDRLDAEEIQSTVYRKQLVELTNRNASLQAELVEVRTRCDELAMSNEKMAKSMRNSTSKVRAEEEMEDLRDRNRILERNLDGAGNRINELQETKTRLMKELVDLRVQYETTCTENGELKSVLSSHRSSVADTIELREKYETLLQQKNRLDMELVDKRSRFVQMEKKIETLERENEELRTKNTELDAEMDDIVLQIRELTKENSELDDKLYNTQKSVDTYENKIKELTTINRDLETRLACCVQEIEALKSQRKKSRAELATATKISDTQENENSELRNKLSQYDRSDSLSCGDSERSSSPALESIRVDNRRRRSRNELFNLNRPLEMFENHDGTEDCGCKALKQHYSKLEKDLALKNAKIATLELKIQSEIFPHMRKCKDLEEILASMTKKNKLLKAEIRKLEETRAKEMSSECERCKHWRMNKRDQASQCMPESTPIYMSGMSSGIIDGHVKVNKLEKEKTMLKNLCRNRQKQIFELQDRIKELEKDTKVSTNDEKSTTLESAVLGASTKSDSASGSRHFV